MADPRSALDRLLDEAPPHVADLVRRCRGAILAAMPDATERVYLGWRGVGFHHPTAGYVCAVFPADDHAKVGFEHGHLLHDPHGRLEGTGKRVRYLVVTDWNDHVAEALDDFIAQAIQLR